MAFSRFRNSVRRQSARRGTALILTAVILIPLLALLALVIDWGRLCVTKGELQRAADAAAMAAAQELAASKAPGSKLTPAQAIMAAKKAAREYAAMNTSFGKPLELLEADIQLGYLANPAAGGPLDTSNPARFNAVRIIVRRDEGSNGSVPTFFARISGKDKVDCRAEATAAFIDHIKGFRQPIPAPGPEEGPSIPILPLVLDVETWHAAMNGVGTDQWMWDETAGKFVSGSDGIPEFNMYPQRQNDRSFGKDKKSKSGNGGSGEENDSAKDRGTVNIGIGTHDVSHLARQIVYGVTQKDWEFHNGELTFDENGELFLSGNQGISPLLDDALSRLRNQGRIVPVFREMNGKGDETVYTIVEWVGLKIIDVQLGGRDDHIIAQAGEVTTVGVVPADDPVTLTSSSKNSKPSRFIRSRIWLAR